MIRNYEFANKPALQIMNYFFPSLLTAVVSAALFKQDKSFCCRYASVDEDCHDTCLQIFTPNNRKYMEKLEAHFPTNCPQNSPDLVEFWNCLMPSYNDSSAWIGRMCCELALTDTCRKSCLHSQSFQDLSPDCSTGYEQEMYRCVYRQQHKKRCCLSADDASSSCRHQCELSFRSETGPTFQQITHVATSCGKKMASCMRNFSRTLREETSKNVHCCGRATDLHCRRYCYEIFRSEIKDSTIVNRLIQECGDVMPHQPMWKCFMENTEPAPAGPFAGKLKCCSKAKSYECKEMCSQLYKNPWSESDSWNEFEQMCIYNTERGDLQQCLEETSEPCRMGCSSMRFCTAFNRPTALFRACNEDSDFMAKHHFKLWSKGSIDLPRMKIPVKDIETCEADLWKAVACSLQIKPCDAETGESIICKSDCLFLLNKCADKKKLQAGIDVEELCEMFSPSYKQDKCISLSTLTESSNIQEIEPGRVTQPCRPDPCENNEVCVTNRNKCRPRRSKCQKYNCVRGCKLRHKSNVVAPVGSTVLVPNSTKEETCFKACTCTETGHFRSCIRLPCVKFSSCKMDGRLIDHGEIFEKDCNTCTCYAGQITCSQYSCSRAQYLADPPCNCTNLRKLTCVGHGRKYFSRCIEVCSANVSVETQPCKLQHPCIPSPCKSKERCIPISRVCLSTAPECLQYECLPRYRQCLRILNSASLANQKKITHQSYSSNNVQNTPSSYFFSYTTKFFAPISACDNRNHDHENICQLVKNKRNKFSYLGQCKAKCRKSVNNFTCGYDMMTYDNDCVREANLVLAQYKGTCKHETGSDPCKNVACPPLSNGKCASIRPPGSCCPICGAMIRVLIDQAQIKIIEKVASKGPVTVRNVLLLLRHLIDVLECQLYGHLSNGGELIAIIVSTETKPSLMQIKACIREAEKITILINKKTLSPDLIMSPLVASVFSPSLGSASLVSFSAWLLVGLVFYTSFSIT